MVFRPAQQGVRTKAWIGVIAGVSFAIAGLVGMAQGQWMTFTHFLVGVGLILYGRWHLSKVGFYSELEIRADQLVLRSGSVERVVGLNRIQAIEESAYEDDLMLINLRIEGEPVIKFYDSPAAQTFIAALSKSSGILIKRSGA